MRCTGPQAITQVTQNAWFLVSEHGLDSWQIATGDLSRIAHAINCDVGTCCMHAYAAPHNPGWTFHSAELALWDQCQTLLLCFWAYMKGELPVLVLHSGHELSLK